MKISEEDKKQELKRLDKTIALIDEILKNTDANLKTGEKELKEFQKLTFESYRELDKGEKWQFNYENKQRIEALEKDEGKYYKLLKVRNNPYFGSIIFDKEEIYIGITSIKKDLDYYVYDWRAPISSMFYDYGLGKSSYESPRGTETGIITRKRQYKIEDAKLIHIFDTNMNIDDDILQEVLATHSEEKMKNIVNTIQAEQNQVIRENNSNTVIVQGIAGSGKTSVALHRIAYLLYRLEYLNSSNVLIFSPNNVFTEYISNVLPELGEDNTLQTTYHEFVSNNIIEYDKVESYSSFVERFYKNRRQDNDLIEYKLSDRIIKNIESFVKYYVKAARFIKDLEYKNKVISMDELNELLHDRYDKMTLMERVDLIAEKINNVYFKGKASDEISIKSRLFKIANFKKDYKKIYSFYFESAIFKDNYKLNYRRNENLRNIEKKVLNYEDATIFLYLKFLLEGYPYQVAVREVVIDEAQDYTYLQYMMIKKIFKNAHFTILGDIHQTVNPYYRYDNLEVLMGIFKENSKYIELNKSYRSSPEIIEYANSILGLSLVSAIRRTEHLPVIKRDIKDLKHIGRDIKYLKNKYKSIVVVTKSIEEAKILAEGLKNNYKNVTLIDIETTHFNKQLCVSPAYGVKGLEFDSVIIINNFASDKYLYYVAVTRAQHELIIYE